MLASLLLLLAIQANPVQASTEPLCTELLEMCELEDENERLENRVRQLESCVRILQAITASRNDDKAYRDDYQRQLEKEQSRIRAEEKKGMKPAGISCTVEDLGPDQAQ